MRTIMSNSISIIGDKCFGCNACAQVCTNKAIILDYNSEGFLYPYIDEIKCTNCGQCLKMCPANSNTFLPKRLNKKCYAAFSNSKTAIKSSSGGVFSLLAKFILQSGGSVCGAAFNNSWLVSHKIIFNISDLEQLRTSKYVQSHTGDSYSEIQNLLSSGKQVLFAGTPCQVAGLYGFLGEDHRNLLTCDVFCHGVPSPKVWAIYLKEITEMGDVRSINFRDKTDTTWEKSQISICWKTIKGDFKHLTEQHSDNIFMLGFLRNLYLRRTCGQCPFAKTPRVGDISLGDFWGYRNISQRQGTQKGISAVLLNSHKGEKFFANIMGHMEFTQKVALSDIVQGNPVLEKPCQEHKNRTAFMNEFSHNSSKKISDMIHNHLEIADENCVGILNFGSYSTTNYGAVLVAFAMEKAIAKIGYKPTTINFVPSAHLFQVTSDCVFSTFRKHFLHLTGICTSKVELKKNINPKFYRLCIGSDQIVRAGWHHDFIYYLDWAYGKKTLISYAASFGKANLRMTVTEQKNAKKCINRFDAFSVRESSGMAIMDKYFNKKCSVVCDPTMLLDANDYQPIIDMEAKIKTPPEYVAFYFLNNNREILSKIGENHTLVDAYRDENGKYRTVGDWLYIIKNAKFVVTDSFHGSIFSIIFQKQFIALPTLNGGNERLKNLMSMLGTDKFIMNGDIVDEKLFEHKIDYAKFAATLSEIKAASFLYLKNALSIPPTSKPSFETNGDDDEHWLKLLGFLPVLKSKEGNKTSLKMLGIIPLVVKKNKKLYLFSAIRIA